MERTNLSRPGAGELVLVRHAPAAADGRLCGRTDVAAVLDGSAGLDSLRDVLAGAGRRVTSPALRCLQTAQVLWPDLPEPELDDRLWEQDFGDHDGLPYGQLPDLGALDPAALAAHRPPNGESFDDAVARMRPALLDLADTANDAGPVVVIAHAGTVRAALALALDDTGAALGFEVAPLSVTRLRRHAAGWTVIATNWTAA